MSAHKKLMRARLTLQSLKLKKSGLNKFAGYSYFELGDFIPTVQSIFFDLGLCGVVSYGQDIATLTITDVDDGTFLTITSPMSTAALKGCHEVQNLGAVETYVRRYLWVTAMEIVEHDALDATVGADNKKTVQAVRHSPVEPFGVTPERMSIIAESAEDIKGRMFAEDVIGAYEIASQFQDPEEKQALWKLLDSKTRSAITKHANFLKEAA